MNSKKDKLLFIGKWAIIVVILLMFYLFAYFPGAMSSDSFSQWAQMSTFRFGDWHPILSSLFFYLCTRVWYSPASVVIAQIVILSVIYLSGMYELIKIGVSKIVLSITILVFAIYPANGLMLINLWKDVMFSIMLLWMTINLFKIIQSNGSWLNSKVNSTIFIINSLGVMLFRHNGIVSFVLVMVFMAVAFKKNLKVNLILTTIILASYLIISGPVYTYLGNVKSSNFEAFSIPMQQVAAVIKYDGVMNSSEKEFFNKILPLEVWKDQYNPLVVDYIKFNPQFNKEFAVQNKGEFIRNWISVVLKNPQIATKAYLDQTGLVWNLWSWINPPTREIIENDFGLKNTIVIPKVKGLAERIISFTNINSALRLIFWKPSLWLYISIISGIIIAKQLSKKYLLLLIPILSNAFVFMIATPAQDYRYMYANFLIAAFLIPIAVHTLWARREI
jgi:hypothetical protein